MPRKTSAFSKKGTSILSRKKVSLSKRGLPGVYKPPPQNVRALLNGRWQTLNIPESIIYRALEDMKVNFRPQVPLSGGWTKGGALCDFILDDYRINLEFQGPFHRAEADFWRKVAREKNRFMVVYLYDRDLINIHKRLKEIMGMGH